MEDIVLQRFEEGKCGICARELGEDFQRVPYKGKKVWICSTHPAPKTDVEIKPIPEGGV